MTKHKSYEEALLAYKIDVCLPNGHKHGDTPEQMLACVYAMEAARKAKGYSPPP